jgi:hypothetical protein
MLLILALILAVLWIGGLALAVAGSLIHILLILAVIVVVLHFVRGGRSRSL